jgi:hypothetical protein
MFMGNYALGIIEAAPAILVATSDKRPIGFLIAVMAICIFGLGINIYIRKRDGKSDKKNKSIDKQKITRHNQTDKDNNEAGQK